jgi:hypothetical protein
MILQPGISAYLGSHTTPHARTPASPWMRACPRVSRTLLAPDEHQTSTSARSEAVRLLHPCKGSSATRAIEFHALRPAPGFAVALLLLAQSTSPV